MKCFKDNDAISYYFDVGVSKQKGRRNTKTVRQRVYGIFEGKTLHLFIPFVDSC